MLSFLLGSIVGMIVQVMTYWQNRVYYLALRSKLFLGSLIRFAVVFGVIAGLLSFNGINKNYFLAGFCIASIASAVVIIIKARS